MRNSILCGMLNSYVANYLVRMRVSTHVSAAIIERLPVPRPDREDPLFAQSPRRSGSAARVERQVFARLNAARGAAARARRPRVRPRRGQFPLIILEHVPRRSIGRYATRR